MPRTLPVWAFIHEISDFPQFYPIIIKPYHWILEFLVSLLEKVLGCHSIHPNMSSSSDSLFSPSVHLACHSLIPWKVLLRKDKDLCRMISKPDAFFFFDDFFLIFRFEDHQNPVFENHLGYSEVPMSHDLGLL